MLDSVRKNVYCYIMIKDCTQSNQTQLNIALCKKTYTRKQIQSRKEERGKLYEYF